MDSNQTSSIDNHPVKQFEFTGKAGEYFAIWIVNVCLTIVTLGIYSAWAKVRTNQYFYGNTLLDGASFRYLADPKQILKGRVVALVLFMLYYFSGAMSPLIGVIMLVIIMLLVPALIVLSMAFRLRNTSYRNVRFNFRKDYKQAYRIFALPVLFIGAYILVINLVAPDGNVEKDAGTGIFVLVALLPLFISSMYPWWEYMITAFKVRQSSYGDAEFEYHATSGNYYGMYMKAILVPILVMAVIGVIIAIVASIVKPLTGSLDEMPGAAAIGPFIVMLTMLPAYIWMYAYIQTKRTNLIYNNIDINGHKLRSDLRVGYMTYLYITNTLAMLISFGLLMPWAKIRTARYRAQMTSLQPAGDLGSFYSTQQQGQSAYGEEIGEMFDLDIGF